jgi:arginyl-tRNA synthetase
VIDSGVVNPSRLLLVRATQRVIQQTNELLGIGYVDKV